MKKIDICLASHNKNKLMELQYIFKNIGLKNIKLHLASSFFTEEPKETAQTFAGNAFIKAKNCFDKTTLCSVGDDSGIEIEALQGKPGIYSARWAIKGSYSEAFAKIQTAVQKTNNYKAKFVSVLCLYYLQNDNTIKYLFYRGEVEGLISFPPKGKNGFAYDTIFMPHGYQETFAELPENIKNSISHRNNALKLLLKDIPTIIPHIKQKYEAS